MLPSWNYWIGRKRFGRLMFTANMNRIRHQERRSQEGGRGVSVCKWVISIEATLHARKWGNGGKRPRGFRWKYIYLCVCVICTFGHIAAASGGRIRWLYPPDTLPVEDRLSLAVGRFVTHANAHAGLLFSFPLCLMGKLILDRWAPPSILPSILSCIQIPAMK